ncbi:hypothetical protein IG631_09225 [Alternaria alternata]|nr:hypothetical protein IG631_09225 [Alternaria alternata]
MVWSYCFNCLRSYGSPDIAARGGIWQLAAHQALTQYSSLQATGALYYHFFDVLKHLILTQYGEGNGVSYDFEDHPRHPVPTSTNPD